MLLRLKHLFRLLLPTRLAGYLRALFGPGTPLLRRVLLAAGGGAALAATALIALLIYTLALIPLTPVVDSHNKGVLAARDSKASVLLAADGTEIARFRRMTREWIALDTLPKHTIDALISTEDHRFYDHSGIDWKRTLASVFHTLGGDPQGGSTITQQLARNLYPEEIGRSRTVTRKLKEMITAYKIEARYSKREILESYLNSVPFLFNVTGIEMAARTYFDKPANKLNVLESATLVGMLKGTRYYNPVLNPERARERRNVVLGQMLKHGKLTQKTYASLAHRPLKLDFVRQDLDNSPAPHFAEAARRIAQAWAEPLGFDLLNDGLIIHSTLDPRLQKLANTAVARQMEALQTVANVEWATPSGRLLATGTGAYKQAQTKIKPFAHWWASKPELVDAFIRETPEYAARIEAGDSKADALAVLRADDAFMTQLRNNKTRLEAGFVALDPATGRIRAWVGSRDYLTDRFDHVQQAKRQPGSTFKAFVYGAALEAGIDPHRSFSARRVSLRLPNGDVWKPRDSGEASDAGDGEISLEDGLVFSRNTVAAQLINEVGPHAVASFARRVGVRDSALDAVPSLALGTSPVSLLEMASGYATFAAQGQYRAPLIVTRITDRNGTVLAEFDNAPEPAVQPEVAAKLVDMLRGAVDRGTGRAMRDTWQLRADIAGKTGTTQNNTDGWFILMHPQLVTGAWVGFNDQRITMRSDYWGQGGHNASRLVGDFMVQALDSRTIDERAELPRSEPASVGEVVERIGERLRRWFGF